MPTLPGVGDRIDAGGPDTKPTSHVAEVSELIGQEGAKPSTLVGFSYGGLVAGVTAATAPDQFRRLISLDAFVPQSGASRPESFPAVWAPWRPESIPDAVEQTLCRRGFHPIGTYREPAPIQPPFPAERTLPISCTAKPPDDPTPAIAASTRAAGIRVVEIATGHLAMLTMPDQLVGWLLDERCSP